MHFFKNTIVAAHKLRVQAANALAGALRSDLFQHVIDPLAEKCRPFGLTAFVKTRLARPNVPPSRRGTGRPRPSVFASYATDERLKGSHRYCGGEKLLNNLVLLLRRHGYDAHMVSLDGAHASWLVEHAPFLSLPEFIRDAAEAKSVRYVTSWVLAEASLSAARRFTFGIRNWPQRRGAISRACAHDAQSAYSRRRGFEPFDPGLAHGGF